MDALLLIMYFLNPDTGLYEQKLIRKFNTDPISALSCKYEAFNANYMTKHKENVLYTCERERKI